MGDKETLKQFVVSLQNKYSSLPLGYANFVTQKSQRDQEKAKNLYIKAIKEKCFVSKEKGKLKEEEGLLTITFLDVEKISKFYKKELKKQRKTFEKEKTKRIALESKIKDLGNLISNLKTSEIKDNPLKGMKNSLHSFEGFLTEIFMPEHTSTTYV